MIVAILGGIVLAIGCGIMLLLSFGAGINEREYEED